MEGTEPVELVVHIGGDGLDAEQVDVLTRSLLVELRQLPVEARLATGGTAPRGAKGDLLAVGELVVAALPGVLTSVVTFLQSWLKRGDGKTLKIKWTSGKSSFAVDLPRGEFSHQQLNDLLANLQAGPPAAKPAAGKKEP